ncbi:MAG: class I SAM-dependent methyltransferase [Planctomycetes bacterium]|nr:class I SAM-dependent methyltransferase [Planctomycetota bacterium]
MSSPQPVNTTYEPFSMEPEYVEANHGFVARQDLTGVKRFLDLACGTGSISELLLQQSPSAHLNGIDYDPVQVDLSAKHFTELGYTVRRGFELTDEVIAGKPVLVFGVGSADELPFPDGTFDSVTIGNAIHVLPDKERFLAAVARVLRPGGVFGFNSSFYAGTNPPGAAQHMYEWLKEASAYIERKNEKLRAEGRPPIKRVRGTRGPAFSNRWYSPQEWTEMLGRCGLRVHDSNERTVYLDERCLATVGAYGGLAEVVMSGYPVEEASEALQATAGISLRNMNIDRLPRNWLEMWATRE